MRQISETKRRKGEERMCVGVEDESSGMGITENTLVLMTDGFCGSGDSPGRRDFYPP